MDVNEMPAELSAPAVPAAGIQGLFSLLLWALLNFPVPVVPADFFSSRPQPLLMLLVLQGANVCYFPVKSCQFFSPLFAAPTRDRARSLRPHIHEPLLNQR